MGHMMDVKEHWSFGTPPEETELTEVGSRVRIRRARCPGPGAFQTKGSRVGAWWLWQGVEGGWDPCEP